jgi:hypothetical protein
MSNLPQPQRQGEYVVTDANLAALLAGTADAIPGLRPVADVLAALTAEPSGMELAGEDRALAEFRRRAGVPIPAQRARRGTTRLTSRLGIKVGASVTAAAVVLGGGVAAAFADVLPAPIQRLAHEAIGAPVPAPQHGLPSHGGPGTHGRSSVHGKPAERGGSGANQGRPHATPTPTAHGNRQDQGKHGNPPGQDQGQGQGQGNGQGDGQGQDNGNGQGNGSGQANGNGHGQGKGQGNGQGQRPAGPHGPGQQGNPHKKGPHGSPQINQRPAGHPRRSVRTRPVMDP